MLKNIPPLVAAIVLALVVLAGPMGCPSRHEEGVTSSLRSQWVTVGADPKKTTDAARYVLEQEALREIKAESTNVDGIATGKMADGKPVKVDIRKKGDAASEVTVTVGTVGDSVIGAEIAKKIKLRAEGR
jgi:hypothetical protein